ncbi:MAG: hypothetical protein KKC80_08595 [Candidatus Margulisbacteria bacterium]|nr:hypothetical protein [Candidatus Margulisiibacteriota bacterium]MBU1617049.1 hypothetical protein [Candidatus Margulisiibacteriota bacterium]
MLKNKDIKQRCAALQIKPASKYDLIKKLIINGYFDMPRNTGEVLQEIRLKYGKRMKSNEIHTYMKKFMLEDIIKAIQHNGIRGNNWVLVSYNEDISADEAHLGRTKKQPVLPKPLAIIMQKDFKVEMKDLDHNYGNSGTCTAFLLRKILEKLIFKVFAKHNKLARIGNKTNKTEKLGLEKMIDIATTEKNKGIPYLSHRTANEVKGIKFLGDTSAHNYLTNVDMKTITPQMPYIITAYEELMSSL